jgi:hypothetical protein
MARMGSEPMTPIFERAKKFHPLDRSATVLGNIYISVINFKAVSNVLM